jgi:hypothetical protein
MVRANVYLTNLTKADISVGMTTIKPGETTQILHKDFERKASYIDRMIKEGKLSLGGLPDNKNTEAPSVLESKEEAAVTEPPSDLQKDSGSNEEDLTNKEDASDKEPSSAEKSGEDSEQAAPAEEATPAEEAAPAEKAPTTKTRGRRKKQ